MDASQVRKIIFATNIAETSLTVDGIGFVVDAGVVKQKHFNDKTGLEQLQVVSISQVQAIQRAGRAGRTQRGKCYRLYTEDFFHRNFKKETVPEILRSDLSSVLLQMKALGIEDVLNFDFMDKPDRRAILSSMKQLFLVEAVDLDGRITDFGKKMAELPLQPTFARCLLESIKHCVAGDMITLLSLLSML